MTRTASCYTHKVQVVSTAQNLKVEYPGKVAVTPQPLAPTLPCYPSYTPITYIPAAKCPSYKPVCLQPAPPPPPVPVGNYIWNAETDIDPTVSGNANFLKDIDITGIQINKLDFDGNDRSAFLLSIVAGGTLYLKSTLIDYTFLITSVTDNGSYVTLGLTPISAVAGTGTSVPPNFSFSYLAP
jgi:hypothetical protein